MNALAQLDYNFIQSEQDEKNILILIHGYGSNKEDLTSLCPYFKNLPNTSFYVLNAPFLCDSGFGFQWFPLDFSNNDINIVSIDDLFIASDYINNFIKYLVETKKIPFNRIAILGFSQGGVLSLFNALYGENSYAAVICHSGLFKDAKIPLVSKNQNLLLVHGKEDPVVSFYNMKEAEEFFKANYIKYETFYAENLEHSMNLDTIIASENFIKKHLY